MKTKRRLCLLISALLGFATAMAIDLPQFSSSSYEGWEYNSNVALNAENITKNNIVLYVSASGKVVTLTSPQFECEGGETINIYMRWMADQWQDDGFVPANTALTVAVLEADSIVRDSVTYVPETLSRSNYINIGVTIPKGLTSARLRFASWKATVNNCNAIRKMELTVVEPSVVTGDVNGDGDINISDVTALIDLILSGQASVTEQPAADVNGDGGINISDVTALIDNILTH